MQCCCKFTDGFVVSSNIKINHSLKRFIKSENSVDLLKDVLSDAIEFYARDMVDDQSSTNKGCSRFFYECYPPTGERCHLHMPIRDLAAAWDATKAMIYLVEHQKEETESFTRLEKAVRGTIQTYSHHIVSINTNHEGSEISKLCLTLDPRYLQEAANIAHSALMILTCTNALRLSILSPDDIIPLDKDIEITTLAFLQGLTEGILSRQISSGAFVTQFAGNSDIYYAIDFFPGEAMLALMDFYDFVSSFGTAPLHPFDCMVVRDVETRHQLLHTMERAFDFYHEYYRSGQTDVNYNIWQLQAFAKYWSVFDTSQQNDEFYKQRKQLIYHTILQMTGDILQSITWKYQLLRGFSFYPNISTIEIVCGLDALADGLNVLSRQKAKLSNEDENKRSTQEDEAFRSLLEKQKNNAITFLKWTQQQIPRNSTVGYGGLGFGGINILKQRLDVTGHAISALTKLYHLEKEGC